MAEIEEGAIPKVTTQADTDYIRKTNAAGVSESILKSLVRWAFPNITGLQDALDAKQNFTALKSTLAFAKASGQTNGSGLEAKTLGDEAGFNLAFNGLYTVETPFEVSPMGNIEGVIALSNDNIGETPSETTPKTSRQLVFTDKGIYFRVYSPSTWSNPMFLGGSPQNFTVTYAELETLVAGSHLTPGTQYRITDFGQDNGLIITAATSETFNADGIRLAIIPAHLIGTHSTIVWKGHWATTLTASDVDEDDHFIYYGKVYRSLTGEVGAASNYALDETNWYLIEPVIGDFYVQAVHGCSYKFVSSLPLVYTKGFIYSEWDEQGNTLSEIVEDADGFTSDMNDWHLNIDGGEFNGNILRRIYNNTIASGNAIMRCSGNGDIYNTLNCDIIDCVLPDETNNIRNATGSTITKNVLGGSADIQYLATGSTIQNNTINGDVKGDSSAYSTITLTNTTVGHTGEIKDNLVVSVTDSIIHGVIDSNINAELINTIMEPFATVQLCTKAKLSKSRITANGNVYACDCATFMYENSVISTQTTETLSANKYVRDDITPFKATDGETFRLDTPVYCDVNASIASGTQPATNAPTWAAFTANTNSYTFAINDYKDLETIEIPHRYKEGTDIEVHLHLTTNGLNNATARKVKYILYYTYGLPDNGTNQWIAEASLTAELTIPANQADKSAYYLSMGTVSGTNIKIGTQFKCRIKRIAGTGAEPINDPFLGQVGIHFQADTLGSRTISAK